MSSDPIPSAEALPVLPPPGAPPAARREWSRWLVRLALGAAWSARHPLEPFAAPPAAAPEDRHYYRSEDGWEAPLWRYPALPGQPGEPVLLVHGLGCSRGFDYTETSLVGALRARGFDVFVAEHRGDPNAVSPSGRAAFDFDDIAAQDVPAMLAAVRRITGFERVLWVGHAMGGQLLYAHLARGGAPDLAAAVTLAARVRFEAPPSQARLAALTATLLPPSWALPARVVQRALSAFSEPDRWSSVARDVPGAVGRGFMLHGTQDVPAGLIRQVGRWFAAGTLCDRGDRLDYLAALQGVALPVLGVAAEGDRICPPDQARPAIDALQPELTRWLCLGPELGHLDLLLGQQSGALVFPEVVSWLDRWRKRCW